MSTDAIVVDASVIGPLILKDEATGLHPALKDALATGHAIAPAHWPVEILSIVQNAIRRGRVDRGALDDAFTLLRLAGVGIVPLEQAFSGALLDVTLAAGLTVYDAAYLDLARTRGARLMTADARLATAARAAGVVLA